MLCRWIEADLTAYVDGELSNWRAAWVRRHLSRCPPCAREAGTLECAVVRHRRLLAALGSEGRVDSDDLWRGMRARLDEVPPAAARWAWPRWVPSNRLVLATATACAVAAVFLSHVFDPWLIAVGIEDPPRVVAEKPELFLEYPMFEHLEAIERIDRPENSEHGRRHRGLQRG